MHVNVLTASRKITPVLTCKLVLAFFKTSLVLDTKHKQRNKEMFIYDSWDCVTQQNMKRPTRQMGLNSNVMLMFYLD